MLDWSYSLLSSELQTCFCELAVFPGRFTVAEAEEVCSMENVQAGLIALVDQSLLEQQPCVEDNLCFKMSSIVREYAMQQQRG
jgi:predicted ATPase